MSTQAKKKYNVKEDVGFQKNMNRTLKESEATLATGGGTPIAKDHKRTNEHRVLQPRDPETGKFDYNSSANISRKYEYHAERNGAKTHKKTVPYFARGLEANYATAGVKKGDVISVNGYKYISTCNLTADEFNAQLENYLVDDRGGTHLGNDINWMRLGGRNDPNDPRRNPRLGMAKPGGNRKKSLKHFSAAVEQRTAKYLADPKGKKYHKVFAKYDRKSGVPNNKGYTYNNIRPYHE